jgi:dihydroflavonol-4-reductase
MRALVTGGTGFVGSHLLEALRDRGLVPRALVRSRARAERLGLTDIDWLLGDLRDPAVLREAVRDVDVVFHLAGVVAARTEREYEEVNVEGTRRLLEAAAETGPRFILVSSLAAAGPSGPGQPRRGDEPPLPVTAYGRSKLRAEAAVRASTLPWTLIRPPAVYGPRDTEMFRLFRAARIGVAPVFGRGDQELSLVYGPDLARALVDTALAPATAGGVYYPAHPERLTQAEVARTIGRAMGRTVRVARIPGPIARAVLHLTGAAARLLGRATILNPDKANEFLQPAWTCDPAPLEQASGWRAQHDLAAGAAAAAEWYRRHGWL